MSAPRPIHGRGRPLAAVLVLAGLAVPAWAAGGAGAVARHAARKHAATKAPAAKVKHGDWEAQGTRGSEASFLVANVTQRVHHKKQHFLAVEDLVVNAPIACSNASGAVAPYNLQVVSRPMPIAANGSFHSTPPGRRGGVQVSGRLQHGRLAITYRYVLKTTNQFDGAPQVCDTRRIQLTAAPGHRRAITNGVWSGQTQNNEPVEFQVVAGGRALQTTSAGGKTTFAFQVQPVSAGDNCPGQTGSGGTDSGGAESGVGAGAAYEITGGLFVATNGTFDNSQVQYGDSQAVTGRFTSSRRATGTFSNPQQGCSWTWGASVG